MHLFSFSRPLSGVCYFNCENCDFSLSTVKLCKVEFGLRLSVWTFVRSFVRNLVAFKFSMAFPRKELARRSWVSSERKRTWAVSFSARQKRKRRTERVSSLTSFPASSVRLWSKRAKKGRRRKTRAIFLHFQNVRVTERTEKRSTWSGSDYTRTYSVWMPKCAKVKASWFVRFMCRSAVWHHTVNRTFPFFAARLFFFYRQTASLSMYVCIMLIMPSDQVGSSCLSNPESPSSCSYVCLSVWRSVCLVSSALTILYE